MSEQLKPLPPAEVMRLKAEARKVALMGLGDPPKLEDFTQDVYSEYPRELVRAMTIGFAVVAFLAWLASAVRVLVTAYQESDYHMLNMGTSQAIATSSAALQGVVLVALAELTVIVMMLSRKILFARPEHAPQRRIVGMVAALALLVAVSSNFHVTQAHVALAQISFDRLPIVAFSVAESLLPVVVVGVSIALEQIALSDIKAKQASQRRHYDAKKAYAEKVANIEGTEAYKNILYPMSYQVWLEVNAVGRGASARVAAMQAMNDDEVILCLEGMLFGLMLRASGDAPPLLEAANVTPLRQS